MAQKDKILSDRTPDAENEMWAAEIWGWLRKSELQEPKGLRTENSWGIRKIHFGVENVKATFKPQPGGT